MWVETRTTKDGQTRYRFLERYTCPYSGKIKRVSVTYATNSRQAHKAAQIELQALINKATNTNVAMEMTLDTLLTKYLESRQSFRKPSTQRNYRIYKNKILEIIPADILIGNINTYTLQNALDAISLNRSYSYTKAIFSLLRQAFKYARRMEFIHDISFFDNLELQKPVLNVEKVQRQRDKFLTQKELKLLLNKLDAINPTVALLCEFQSLTGLRFGEMVALRVQDYDDKKSEIDVNASLSSYGSLKSETIRSSPKNIYSIRKVSLDARAKQIINHFITMNKSKQLWNPRFAKTDYIFVTDGGYPFDVHFVNKILKKVGFHKPISSHTFRHTHISFLAEANVPLKAIMERVGHNEPRTTLAVYTHVTDEMKSELNNAINKIGSAISHK